MKIELNETDIISLLNKALSPNQPAEQDNSFEVGEAYLIRTVTMMYTGRITKITKSDIALEYAAWIADSGRYSDALEKGTLNVVEPYPDGVAISRASIVDFAIWTHPLPREQKPREQK